MPINFNAKNTYQGCQNQCLDKFGCPPNQCPDHTIRRHDTKPPFKVSVEDCDGPMDIQGLVVEVNMWALAKLKKAITQTDTSIQLADGIGFEQIMVGDIILFDRVRVPEYMLVTGFDEDNNRVLVERGYRNTTPTNWKKGTKMRIFRILNAPAQTELVYEDIPQVDGTTLRDQLTGAYVIYEWAAEDTCMPGCFWLEFKLLKMKNLVVYLPGGNWTGPVHLDDSGNYWTGSVRTESSVPLSYDGVDDLYIISGSAWTGDFHLSSDGSYYTGLEQNDGSVVLNRDDVTSDEDTSYSDISTVSTISVIEAVSVIPVIPSTDPSLIIDPAQKSDYYGCMLGEGVEWVRRLPATGEGFLIKIENSFTPDL